MCVAGAPLPHACPAEAPPAMQSGQDDSQKPLPVEVPADEPPPDLSSLRQVIYEQVRTLDSRVIRQMLANHVRECQTPHCPTCSRMHERAIRRRRAMRMLRWRGVAKTIGPQIALQGQAGNQYPGQQL